ncbi:MAG: nucleotidyltransferase domain-containing protein [Candidatus Sumerlaeaceae bacterium]
MLDAETLRDFAQKVRQAFPGAQVYGFGSRVRGDATIDSDLDLCVVVPSLTPAIRDSIWHIAWEIGFERGVVLQTLCYEKESFESGPHSFSPLVRDVLAHGIIA